MLDMYYCTECSEEFAVGIEKEPSNCPFCTGEVTHSHRVEEELNKQKNSQAASGMTNNLRGGTSIT